MLNNNTNFLGGMQMMIATIAEKKAFDSTERLYETSLYVLKHISCKKSSLLDSKDSTDFITKFHNVLSSFQGFRMKSYFTLVPQEDGKTGITCIIKCLNPVTKRDITSFLANGSKAIADAIDVFLPLIEPDLQTSLESLKTKSKEILISYETAAR